DALVVADADVHEVLAEAGFGGLGVPLEGLGGIFGDAVAVGVGGGEFLHGAGITVTGGLLEGFDADGIILWHADADHVADGDDEDGGRVLLRLFLGDLQRLLGALLLLRG